MNYNNMLCNYRVSSTGNSNFNIRIVKTSNKRTSNVVRVINTKNSNKAVNVNKAK